MENLLDSSQESKGLELDDNAIYHLDETRKWTSFLSILGFIVLGLMIIGMFFAVTLSGTMNTNPYFTSYSAVIMIIICIIYMFPLYYLVKFSSESKQAVRNKDSVALSSAMKYLKLHYRFVGILTIIVIAFYILAIIMMLAAGGSMMHNDMEI